MYQLQDITGMISALAQLMQTMKRLDLPTRQEKEEFLLHIEVFFLAQNHVLASQPESLNMCNKQIEFAGFNVSGCDSFSTHTSMHAPSISASFKVAGSC